MDSDYVMAMKLSDEWNYDVIDKDKENKERPLSVVDPTWELIDPVPDIRELFVEFNAAYFDQMLAGVEVKWSTRMTLCAGLCCYEGRGGLCSIKLSSPLLKLRPRKDLVETLLHEMIHALLFVTDNNKDHDGHGDEFHKHMYRINKKAGCNITVYHSFHDEVNSYRQHWWRCNGPCVKWPPYYGIVRRAMNRAPSQRDPWWNDHKRRCGGSYTKIKEPENYGKKVTKAADKKQSAKSHSLVNNHTANDNKKPISSFFNKKPQVGDSSSIKSKKGGGTISSTRTNSSSTVIIKSKNENKSRNETSTKVNTDSSSKKRSNVHGVDWNSDSGEQVYSASSNNASSNVHGFKMSARKNTDQKINSFKGSGFTLGGTTTKRATVIEKNSNVPDIAMKREMFLKRFQQNHCSIPQSQNKRLKIEHSDSKETERKRDCETENKNEPVATLSLVSPKTSNNVEVIDLNDTAPDDDGDINYVQCPACPKLIKETELNDHLDKCLQ